MENSNKKIYVTQPVLPPLNKFIESLREIWKSKWLTNKGPYHEMFEEALANFLNVKYCNLLANGTLALIIGLEALKIRGEVITTPFSFVATAHALHWNKITPVFCDIEEKTFNMDPKLLEAAITPKTKAIIPVHLFGQMVDMDPILEITKKHNLFVI